MNPLIGLQSYDSYFLIFFLIKLTKGSYLSIEVPNGQFVILRAIFHIFFQSLNF